jgi:hypothetical protein
VIRKKAAPVVFEQRAAGSTARPLSSTVTGSIFAASTLALSLMACRTDPVGPEPHRAVSAAPSFAEKAVVGHEETTEAPVQVKARAAEPTTAPAAPIPTTVVIRPGQPIRMAGARVPIPREQRTAPRPSLDEVITL